VLFLTGSPGAVSAPSASLSGVISGRTDLAAYASRLGVHRYHIHLRVILIVVRGLLVLNTSGLLRAIGPDLQSPCCRWVPIYWHFALDLPQRPRRMNNLLEPFLYQHGGDRVRGDGYVYVCSVYANNIEITYHSVALGWLRWCFTTVLGVGNVERAFIRDFWGVHTPTAAHMLRKIVPIMSSVLVLGTRGLAARHRHHTRLHSPAVSSRRGSVCGSLWCEAVIIVHRL